MQTAANFFNMWNSPWRNIQQDGPLPCRLLLASKTRKAPHQSTMSCDPGITLPVNKCSDSTTEKTEQQNQLADT